MIQVVRTRKEIWKDVPDYEGLYKISNCGKVKSLEIKKRWNGKGFYKKSEKLLNPFFSNSEYYRICLQNGKRKTFQVHQLMAVVFFGHKPCGNKIVINHKDLIKTHNFLGNFELTTNRENCNRKHLKEKYKCTSKYTGVHWDRLNNKWVASINVKHKTKYLGSFLDEVKAALCYQGFIRRLGCKTKN